MKINASLIIFLILSLSSCSSAKNENLLQKEQKVLLKPQFERPESGITIKKIFNITLNYIPAGNCLAVKQDQVTLFISKKLLLKMKRKSDEIQKRKTDKIAKWKTEGERLN